MYYYITYYILYCYQAVAQSAAGNAALNKVANAVFKASSSRGRGGGGQNDEGKMGADDEDADFEKKLNWKSRRGKDDDIFDEKEKIQLGLRE